MRMDRFTTLAQEILSSAQSLAMGKGHAEMTPLHMLVAMLDSADSFAHSVLEKAGFDSARGGASPADVMTFSACSPASPMSKWINTVREWPANRIVIGRFHFPPGSTVRENSPTRTQPQSGLIASTLSGVDNRLVRWNVCSRSRV